MFEGVGEMAPVGGDLLEPPRAFVGELVVFARRTRAAFHPLVVDQLLAPQPRDAGVERALLGRERGGGERGQDVADIDGAAGHDPEDRELQKALTEGRELLVRVWHKLPCGKKVEAADKDVKR